MNWKRIATMGVMGGTLVAWLARASTSVAPPLAPVPTDTTSGPGTPLFPDVDRLRARLHAPVRPAAPTRNLFAFARTPAHVTESGAVSPASAPAGAAVMSAPAHTPPFELVGMAEDAGPDGPVRTAILSGGQGLSFARMGDVVGGYRVNAIAADAVALTALDDGTALRLALK